MKGRSSYYNLLNLSAIFTSALELQRAFAEKPVIVLIYYTENE